MGVIYYNTLSSADYGINVESPPGYQLPVADKELVHVLGRNGDIAIPTGSYQNVTRTYTCSFGKWNGDFYEQLDRVMDWYYNSAIVQVNPFDSSGTRLSTVNDYVTLSDSYDANYIRYAISGDSLNVENILGQGGKFTLDFNCKPQRYLVTGFDVMSSQKEQRGRHSDEQSYGPKFLNVRNPTLFNAQPLYRIEEDTYVQYESEDDKLREYRININNIDDSGHPIADHSYAIYLKPGFGNMIIDCENKDAYYGNTNKNAYVNWPENSRTFIYPGRSNIHCGDAIYRCEVVPRWWKL